MKVADDFERDPPVDEQEREPFDSFNTLRGQRWKLPRRPENLGRNTVFTNIATLNQAIKRADSIEV